MWAPRGWLAAPGATHAILPAPDRPCSWSTPDTRIAKGLETEEAPLPAPQSAIDAKWPVKPSKTSHPSWGQLRASTLKANSRVLSPSANPTCHTRPSLKESLAEPVQFWPAETKLTVPPPRVHTCML